ncbi:hypothetical protein [Enterovirga sp. CN4-39]|uniref:hypothetical protein n=1 Tax=Enterovirga sp. CN4-39 TaxID=3400910 RepID=UPI003C0BA347
MPEFTVIEGGGGEPGGPGDREAARARYALKVLLMECLRAVARGDDHGVRVTRALLDLYERLSAVNAPIYKVVQPVVEEAYKAAVEVPWDTDERYLDYRRPIIEASLRVAAEAIADDPAARGRKSQRETSLDRAIEEKIRDSEERSREHGWSYTQHLTRHLGPWPVRAPRLPAAKRRRKTTKAVSKVPKASK